MLFVGLRYPPIRKLGFQKKKKKKILPDTTTKLVDFGLIRNRRENNYFETSLNFGKRCQNDNKWGPGLFFLRSLI